MRGGDHGHREKEMDSLAELIRQELSESGICRLNQADLELLWLRDKTPTIADKRIRVMDFSFRHGFVVEIDPGFSSVVFKNSD